MKSFLPNYKVSKVLLDSAHDTMPYYLYFKRENITPFIILNGKGGSPPVYKMTLPLIMTVFLSVPLVIACVVMVLKSLRTE